MPFKNLGTKIKFTNEILCKKEEETVAAFLKRQSNLQPSWQIEKYKIVNLYFEYKQQ